MVSLFSISVEGELMGGFIDRDWSYDCIPRCSQLRTHAEHFPLLTLFPYSHLISHSEGFLYGERDDEGSKMNSRE